MTRCPLRRHRHALLPPLRLPLRVPNPLHPARHISRSQWQIREHAVNTLLPGTVPTRPSRHTVSIPKGLLHDSRHRAYFYKVANLEHSHSQHRWQTGLGHQPTAGIASVDGPYAELEAAVQCEAGHCELGEYLHHWTGTVGTCRQWTDIPNTSEGGRGLCCASKVHTNLAGREHTEANRTTATSSHIQHQQHHHYRSASSLPTSVSRHPTSASAR
jgi:hypothetical protein